MVAGDGEEGGLTKPQRKRRRRSNSNEERKQQQQLNLPSEEGHYTRGETEEEEEGKEKGRTDGVHTRACTHTNEEQRGGGGGKEKGTNTS